MALVLMQEIFRNGHQPVITGRNPSFMNTFMAELLFLTVIIMIYIKTALIIKQSVYLSFTERIYYGLSTRIKIHSF